MIGTVILLCMISRVALADAIITFHGTLISAPQCVINTNDMIDVDFGNDIITSQVDGVNYKKQIEYTLYCVSPAKQGLTLAISGTTASFNAGLLKTSKTDLGIRLFDGSTILLPGAQVKFNYGSEPLLYAVPVAQDNTTLTAGPFTGTATMVIAYQ